MSKRRNIRLEVIYERELTLCVTIPTEGLGRLLFSLPLRRNPFGSTEILCEEILRSYKQGDYEERDDFGTPTPEQLRHWQFHLILPKVDHCEICRAKHQPRATIPTPFRGRRGSQGAVIVRRGGGKGTVSKAAVSKPKVAAARTSKSATELGF